MSGSTADSPFLRVMRAARALDDAGLETVASSLRERWLDLTPSHTRLIKNTDKLDALAETAERLALAARRTSSLLKKENPCG